MATVGAAASTGSGAAAVMTDSERLGSSLTAGMLDLDSSPSWGNTNSTDDSAPGSISGNEGREAVTLSVSGNPSYLWFRTQCKTCEPVEETLLVRFGVDTDADGTVDRWLQGFDGTDDGYLTLRAARERYGEGVLLGDLAPEEAWDLVVEWTTDGVVSTTLDAAFDFDFYATQTRHVGNTAAVAPDWDCPDVACEEGGPGDPKDISWVAFCGSAPIDGDDVVFSLTDDGSTVVLEDVPESVDVLLLKYSTRLDVFDLTVDDGPYTVGEGTTYEQDANSYPGTDPERSNSEPCPGREGSYKVDVGNGGDA
jgi:hypothetical protein